MSSEAEDVEPLKAGAEVFDLTIEAASEHFVVLLTPTTLSVDQGLAILEQAREKDWRCAAIVGTRMIFELP
jgi:hypothetical protein